MIDVCRVVSEKYFLVVLKLERRSKPRFFWEGGGLDTSEWLQITAMLSEA